MIKINRLKKYLFNALLLSCVSLVMRTVSVSFNVYVSSKIGSEAMGLLTLTGGIYGFAITFATSGINTAVVRLVSASLPYDNCDFFDTRSNICVKRIMKNALFYCLIFSATASVVLFISAGNIGKYLLGDIRTVPSLKLMSFSLIPISISSALNGYFCAVRRVYKNVIVQFCEQGAKIGVVSFLLLTIAPAGLEYACIAVVAGGALSEGVCVIVSAILYFVDRKRHYRNKTKNVGYVTKKGYFFVENIENLEINGSETKIVPIALPIGVSAYVRSALATIEHLCIPWGLKKYGLDSSASLSSYGTLHGMVIPILLFPSAILGAFSSLLVPELSSAMAQKDIVRIKSIVSRVFSLSLLFSVGVSGIFICYSYEIGMFLYGNNEVGEFIRLLAPLIPLMYLDGSVDSMLKGLGEQVYSMRVNILDSLISVILIVILLPNYGIYGYVAVIFITELINASFSILRLINVTGIKTPIFRWVLVPLICVICATVIARLIFSFVLVDNKLLTIIQIIVTAIIYLLVHTLFNLNQKRDRQKGLSIIFKSNEKITINIPLSE
ncbi:MAG: polysaccharide biosynthesis C-terminal domain-containing protein [Clostridia bacterium]|nr:polysaccharide biosynthesis C-terminal domain-containing protein [Clostridia bacterium]